MKFTLEKWLSIVAFVSGVTCHVSRTLITSRSTFLQLLRCRRMNWITFPGLLGCNRAYALADFHEFFRNYGLLSEILRGKIGKPFNYCWFLRRVSGRISTKLGREFFGNLESITVADFWVIFRESFRKFVSVWNTQTKPWNFTKIAVKFFDRSRKISRTNIVHAYILWKFVCVPT